MLCDDLEGWDGAGEVGIYMYIYQEGGDTCIHIADSHCCTAETKTLKSNYLPINNNKEPKKKKKSESVRRVKTSADGGLSEDAVDTASWYLWHWGWTSSDAEERHCLRPKEGHGETEIVDNTWPGN